MALLLKLRSGEVHPLPELRVDAPRVVVGRAPGCELQLPDPSVSSRHASLRQRGLDYVVVDEGSENGTFIGDTRLNRQTPHSLSDGELLRFGRVWVEVRFEPTAVAPETGASRELARHLVEHALEQEGQAWGMSVRILGDGEQELRLEKPRHPYLIGSHAAADLLLGEELPARCLELRRHGDQVWVTLLDAEFEARLDDRPLALDERRLWPKGALLRAGEVQLSWADPTGQVLEQVERDPTERLAEGEAVDPPTTGKGKGKGKAKAPRLVDKIPSAGDQPPEPEPVPEPKRAPGPASSWLPLAGRWTLLDAVVCAIALSVLGLSVWAIRWIAELGRA
jgi:predicted component of type VI protein secretion system